MLLVPRRRHRHPLHFARRKTNRIPAEDEFFQPENPNSNETRRTNLSEEGRRFAHRLPTDDVFHHHRVFRPPSHHHPTTNHLDKCVSLPSPLSPLDFVRFFEESASPIQTIRLRVNSTNDEKKTMDNPLSPVSSPIRIRKRFDEKSPSLTRRPLLDLFNEENSPTNKTDSPPPLIPTLEQIASNNDKTILPAKLLNPFRPKIIHRKYQVCSLSHSALQIVTSLLPFEGSDRSVSSGRSDEREIFVDQFDDAGRDERENHAEQPERDSRSDQSVVVNKFH